MSRRRVITIGNFDGVHRGHRALIALARRLAGDDGQVVARPFEPHPRTILHPDRPAVARLTTDRDRERLLREAGATDVRRLAATADLLAMPPDQFASWLVDQDHPDVVVEGPNFRFGRGRAGGVDQLRQLGRKLGFEVVVADPVQIDLDDQTIVTASSSLVRWTLAHGRVRDAARILGRPHRVVGRVVPGRQQGRRLGFPTANVEPENALPAPGVYAATAQTPDGVRPTAVNVGRRPTFGGQSVTCEAHLLDFEGPVGHYGWRISLDLIAFLRPELRFGGPDAVAQQIRRDLRRVRALNPEGCSVP